MGRTALAKSAAEKHAMKVESRKWHQLDLRRAAFIADYMLLAAPGLHRQATEFVDRLQAKYPNKRDVRKTAEFQQWQIKQLGGNDSAHVQTTPDTSGKRETVLQQPKEMVLQIPLMRVGAKTKETPTVLEAQEDQPTNIFDDIPNDVMANLIEEIRADPDLCAIMDNFGLNEDQSPEELCPEWDIGLNIEIGDPFEDEINSMLFL